MLASCSFLPGEQSAPDDIGERLGASLHDAAASSEQQRDFTAAATYYRTLLRRRPADPKASVGLSRSLRNLQRPRESEPILRRALRKHADDPTLLEELGKVQLAVGDPAAALDSLSRADRLSPESWSIQSALAVTSDRLGLFERSDAHYRAAMQLSPDNPAVLNNRALSLALQGDLTSAIDHLELASNLAEAGPRVYQNLALLYALDGKLERAERLLRARQGSKEADGNIAYLRDLAANLRSATPAAPVEATTTSEAKDETPRRDGMAARVIARALSALPPAPEDPGTGKQSPTPPVRLEPTVDAPPAAAKSAPERVEPAKPEPEKVAKTDPADKPAAPERRNPAPAPSAAGLYKVQLGSFRSQTAASRFVSSMSEKHERALTDTILEIRRVVLEDRGVLFRVVTNDLPDQIAADGLCQRLRQSGADCVRIPAASVK